MPPDRIIEGLKQGNAVELELVKKLKEGLDLIADGLQRECYNRSDALSELRESIPRINASADRTTTPDQKTLLRHIIGTIIQLSDKLNADSIIACQLAQSESEEAYSNDISRHNEALKRLDARHGSLVKTTALWNDINSDLVDPLHANAQVYGQIKEDHKASVATYKEDVEAMSKDLKFIEDRNSKREERAKGAHSICLRATRNINSMCNDMEKALKSE